MMETLRIVMVTTHYPPTHIGGDAVMVQNLSEELVGRGHEVHIASCPAVFDIVNKGRSHTRVCESKRDDTPNIHSIRQRFPVLSAARSHALGVWHDNEMTLRNLISDIRPDVVHWHNTKAFVGRPFSCKSAANVYTAHDFFAVCPKSSLLRPRCDVCSSPSFCQLCLIRSRKMPQLWRTGRRRVLGIPPGFTTISPSAFLARILESDGINTPIVIPNFVPDPGTPLINETRDRDSVVFVGILERHKGPAVLVDAFASTLAEHNMSLEIIGEGSLREELTKKVDKLGIRDRIRIHGRISRNEIRTLMKRAIVMVVPSIWYENCPLSALEALSFGVPIIASSIGGLPEIATIDAGSRTFTPGSVDELASELVGVHQSRDEMSRIRYMARKSYEEKYSPGRHVDAYLRIFSGRGVPQERDDLVI